MKQRLDQLLGEIERLPERSVFGSVSGIQGMLVEIAGVQGNLSIGDRCDITARGGRSVSTES